jgi:hypothetical protein
VRVSTSPHTAGAHEAARAARRHPARARPEEARRAGARTVRGASRTACLCPPLPFLLTSSSHLVCAHLFSSPLRAQGRRGALTARESKAALSSETREADRILAELSGRDSHGGLGRDLGITGSFGDAADTRDRAISDNDLLRRASEAERMREAEPQRHKRGSAPNVMCTSSSSKKECAGGSGGNGRAPPLAQAGRAMTSSIRAASGGSMKEVTAASRAPIPRVGAASSPREHLR